MKRHLFCVAVSCFFRVMSADAATWNNNVANTPDTAYSWSSEDNWTDGVVGGEGSAVKIEPSGTVYIKMDSSAAPVSIGGNGKAVIIGDITLRQTSTTSPTLGNAGYIYGNVTFETGIYSAPSLCYFTPGAKLCGRPIYSGNIQNRVVLTSTSMDFHFNRYADAAGEVRTGDFDDFDYFGIGNGTATFHAPEGADAVTGSWRLTEGSPYAVRVTDTAHALAVGTAVAAAGFLGDGVYLKRVFDDATIELSAPAVRSGEVELSFAAFTPDFTATLKNLFGFQGGSGVLRFVKKREEDSARIVFTDFCSRYSPTKSYIGGDKPSDISGTFVIKKFSMEWPDGFIGLRNAHIELADNASTGVSQPLQFDDGDCTTRITVNEGNASTFAKVLRFDGGLVKDGAGELTIALDAGGAGDVTLAGGKLAFAKTEGAAEGPLSIGAVTLAAGTVFSVPADGLAVASLATEGAVTVSGGKVIVGDADFDRIDLESITFTDGGSLEFVLAGEAEDGATIMSRPVPEVVGHPAFWVDASQTDTIEYTTENGTNYVTRWNDCREGETMFCTNLVLRPTLSCGEKMSGKYVRLAHHNVEDYHDAEQLVWSVPIRNIRAVFLVQDPVEGGGAILGRCSWRLGNETCGNSWGGPFYRDSSRAWTYSLVADGGSTMPAVRYGRYYLDGREVVGTESGYLGGFQQLAEFHVNAGYAQSAGPVVCDAFGGGYLNGKPSVKSFNGCMRISEYIIYTNDLTYAERACVAQYLSRKWLGRDIRYRHFSEKRVQDVGERPSENFSFNVPDGRVAALEPVIGGTLTKTGDGSLLLNGVDCGASLRVEEGDVTLAANTRLRHVPSDSWIHVDAQEESSVIAAADGTLERWNDVNGNGSSFRNEFSVKAKAVDDAVCGRPGIDLGPVTTSQSAGLVYYGADGTISPKYTELPATMSAPYIKTAFAVYNSSAGGGAVFGGRGSGFPSKGLPHAHSKGDASPIIDTSSSYFTGHGLTVMSNAFAKGTGVLRRNGESVDPFVATFLKADERLTFSYPSGRKMANLGVYGQNANYKGGLKYGEVIMFERLLDSDEIASVEAYLAKRWFGIDTPGYGSSAGAVTVGAGASLTVLGDGFSAASLGGGGTVKGDVTVPAGGEVAVTVSEDGSVSTLTVEGTLRLASGTLTLTGNPAVINPGKYALLTADSLEKSAGEWSVPRHSRYGFSLSFEGDAAYLTVHRKGMMLICR